MSRDQATYYRGIRMIRYDLVREFVLALAISLIAILAFAIAFSSPDLKPETIQSWAQTDPVDFVTTATGELAGSTMSSGYGAPYNDGSNSVQQLGFFSPQQWFGTRLPVDSAHDFVLGPLQASSAGNTELQLALKDWTSADAKQQAAWTDAYSTALKDAKAADDGTVTVTGSGDFGPLPTLTSDLLSLARAGALDGFLLAGGGRFYATDYTRPLLFMGDGGYLASLAEGQHLLASQWGMMNETGSYPGQSWLWLYTAWYQVPPFAGNSAADLMVVLFMGILSLALVLVPYLPILRDIPRWIPIHRLIWRGYYRDQRRQAA